MMNQVLIGLLGAGVIATGGYAAATGIDDSAPARTVWLPGATTADTTTTGTAATTDDIVVGNAPTTAVTTSTEDVSGPCDEAEHANGPRCTGGTDDDGGDDDRSGSNGESDDDSDDDRSGSNSGQG